MHFPTLKILGDIRRELGPSLEKQGLIPTLGSVNTRHGKQMEDDDLTNHLAVSFQNTDASKFSSLELRLRMVDRNGRLEPTLAGATLWQFNWSTDLEVGEDGWLFVKFYQGYALRTLDDDWLSEKDRILAAIDRNRVIELAIDPEKRTGNENFAYAFEIIDQAICLLGDLVPVASRIDGVEGYDFTHPNGEAWRVSFPGKEAVLSVDGVYAGSTDGSKVLDIRCMIADKLYETQERDRPVELDSDDEYSM
jgi:hypothetical protein